MALSAKAKLSHGFSKQKGFVVFRRNFGQAFGEVGHALGLGLKEVWGLGYRFLGSRYQAETNCVPKPDRHPKATVDI